MGKASLGFYTGVSKHQVHAQTKDKGSRIPSVYFPHQVIVSRLIVLTRTKAFQPGPTCMSLSKETQVHWSLAHDTSGPHRPGTISQQNRLLRPFCQGIVLFHLWHTARTAGTTGIRVSISEAIVELPSFLRWSPVPLKPVNPCPQWLPRYTEVPC